MPVSEIPDHVIPDPLCFIMVHIMCTIKLYHSCVRETIRISLKPYPYFSTIALLKWVDAFEIRGRTNCTASGYEDDFFSPKHHPAIFFICVNFTSKPEASGLFTIVVITTCTLPLSDVLLLFLFAFSIQALAQLPQNTDISFSSSLYTFATRNPSATA